MAKQQRRRGLFGQRIDNGDTEIVRLVKLTMRLARRHLSDYAHEKSPKKYTQPQLFACLILKAHLGVTYRRIEELITLMPAVRDAIGLAEAPRFTTLQAFADRPEIVQLVDGWGARINRSRGEQGAAAGRSD